MRVIRDELWSNATETSARHWDYLLSDSLTPKEIVNLVKGDFELRSFSDILKTVYNGEALEEALVDGLRQYSEQFGVDIKEDSLRRKARNWLCDRNQPTDREEVFAIAFALELDEERTDLLLCYLFDQGIHYRNRRELIYAYYLKKEWSYADAVKAARSQPDEQSIRPVNTMLTRSLRTQFNNISEDEDYLEFMECHDEAFGCFHNTAYIFFRQMLDELSCGNDEDEGRCSIEYVVNNCLRMKMPEEKHTSNYGMIEKIIKKYWPGLRSIKAMKARKEDVTRKTLMLLYIVVGGLYDPSYDELDEDYLDTDEALEEHCRRMNSMMHECGMREIDPRNPFDFIVLYCLKPDGDMAMSEKMEAVIKQLFD